eukprot:1154763-Pelagomonas_calceolata.AAC.1
MRIGRVVGHAPRRPDSPPPSIHLRAPSKVPPPPKAPCKQLFIKVNVSILRRDLRRIKVSLSAWVRAHKDSIRAALVAGRGASTIREKKSGIAQYLRIRPEGVADLLVSKLTGWFVGFYVGSDWGSGLYGIVVHLPAIVMVAGGSGLEKRGSGAGHQFVRVRPSMRASKNCGKGPWHLEVQCLLRRWEPVGGSFLNARGSALLMALVGP